MCILISFYVFFAGVRLTVENQSGQKIHDVKIKYDRGSFLSDSIPNKEIRKKSLGKIGEGATFNVKWRENSGIIYQAQFSIYFYGHSGYDSILIRILPNGEAVLYDGEKKYNPDSLGDSSS